MKRRICHADTTPEYNGLLPVEILSVIAGFLDPFTQRMLAGTCHYLVGQIPLTPLLFDPESDEAVFQKSILYLARAQDWIRNEAWNGGCIARSSVVREYLAYATMTHVTKIACLPTATQWDPYRNDYDIQRVVIMAQLRIGQAVDPTTVSTPPFVVKFEDNEFFHRSLFELIYSPYARQNIEAVLRHVVWPYFKAFEGSFEWFVYVVLFPYALRSDLYYPIIAPILERDTRIQYNVKIPTREGHYRYWYTLRSIHETPQWFQWLFPRFKASRRARLIQKESPMSRKGLTPEQCMFLETHGFTLKDE
jgi:hypothetical protein